MYRHFLFLATNPAINLGTALKGLHKRIKVIHQLTLRQGYYRGGSNVITWVRRVREMHGKRKAEKMRQKGRSERFKMWEGLNPPLLALKMKEGSHEPRKVGGHKKLRTTPSWHSARKWGFQSYKGKKLDSSNNLVSLKWTLILASWNPSQPRETQDSQVTLDF